MLHVEHLCCESENGECSRRTVDPPPPLATTASGIGGNTERVLIMKRVILLWFVASVCGCATTSKVSVRPGMAGELKAVHSVTVGRFLCQNEIVAEAVRNTIIQDLLAAGVAIRSAGGDMLIDGTITLANDAVSSGSGGLFVGSTSAWGSTHSASTAGEYVSGITAQFHQGHEIVASATVTQVRTRGFIPSPPEVIGGRVAQKIRRLLR